ncbi:hypothetical protein HanPSC8_Chr11g0494641 [Helianthus annuus]|nr:hypothetical protein HanPSC8_Chr11g0494641 [Helianthus annuus]
MRRTRGELFLKISICERSVRIILALSVFNTFETDQLTKYFVVHFSMDKIEFFYFHTRILLLFSNLYTGRITLYDTYKILLYINRYTTVLSISYFIKKSLRMLNDKNTLMCKAHDHI